MDYAEKQVFFLPPCEYHKLNTLPLHYNGWQQIPLSKPIPIGKYNINDLQFLLLQKVKKKKESAIPNWVE